MASKAPGYSKQLLLAVILFVFGSFAYWLVYSKSPKDEARKADEKKVFPISGKPVKRLEIAGAKDASYTLSVALECRSLAEKLCKPEDTSQWDLVEPVKARADDSTVTSVMRNFGNLTTSDTIDLSTETPEKRESLLKDYGLSKEKLRDPKTLRIRIRLSDDRVFTAYFGDKHPLSDGSFALLSTGNEVTDADKMKVFIVPNWQLAVFGQKTSYFRDKKLIGGNEREVSSFSIALSKKNPGVTISGEKDAAGKWTIKSKSLEFIGDVDTIEGVLSGANQLVAKDFVAERKDDPNGKKALTGAKPMYDLAITTKAGVKRLRLFEKQGATAKGKENAPSVIYATIDGLDPLFEIDPSHLEKLDLRLEDFRLRKLIAVMDRFGVEGIAITSKGKKAWQAKLKKNGMEWKTEDGKAADNSKIGFILDRLSSSIVKSFTGAPPNGETLILALGTPEKPLGANPAYEIEFWKAGNRLYARDLRSTKREAVELQGDFASQLPWDEGFLKNP